MKKTIAWLLAFLTLILSSCSMQSYIPEETSTVSNFLDYEDLFLLAVEETSLHPFDCLVSSTVYYAPDEIGELTGLYLMNMEENTCEKYTSSYFSSLSENCSVKLIDLVRRDELLICSFDMCKPGRNYDYGIYYVSEDRPLYLGDPTAALTERGDGFVFTQKTGFSSTMTFYTEKITDHFYYYEIF